MTNNPEDFSVRTGTCNDIDLLVPGWRHKHSGHCESGVAASMVSYHGMPLSEPLAFGLSSSLIFAHIPFLKIAGQPLTSYRVLPGQVLSTLQRRLACRMRYARFRDPQSAQKELNKLLEAGQPVGLQTSVFWLPYFPPEMRFHFNAHNLVVVGRYNNGDYLVSDPVFETEKRCDALSLENARFARGAFAPRGKMYWLESVPSRVDWDRVIPKAIGHTVRMNYGFPLPFIGVRAIKVVVRKILKMRLQCKDYRAHQLFVGHIIRMQEEIGTGGGGFRFMYAAFLQQAAEMLQDEKLDQISKKMIDAGDQWRRFALAGAEFCRGRESSGLEVVASELNNCADVEQEVYVALSGWLKGKC
ncbi:BtrH N-terminal domain-containing protein [Halorhodospira halochloris]|uniref:BtrH N-terminal domain-containing protein n=1 Tax=Halorhodospira halochloris TaxID=1052 RepID=UPI001EE8A1D7|nr:BtrH N-terminal domain-containing protein [Halorhodospira halochloris]MCG5529933.1 BtrH N-terminal domain-containing protein [Halorhodospira halochloris]